MNELSPAVQALKTELSRAIRRDHQRRRRRHKTLRTGALSLLGLGVLSGAALAAAGGPFVASEPSGPPVEEVKLAHGVSIEAVKSFPEFTGKASDEFVTSHGSGRSRTYIYHVTGGEAREIGCPFPDVHPTNNIYITSTRALTSAEIMSQLRPDGELEGHAPKPEGVISESNGCPNPGVAGQPGTANGPVAAGKAAVTVAPSNRTPEILSSTAPTTTNPPTTTDPSAASPAPTPSTTTTPTSTP